VQCNYLLLIYDSVTLPIDMFTNGIRGMASSILALAVPSIMDELHSNNENLAILVISIFILGFTFGPLIAVPISKTHGRLIVYNVSNIFFLVFNIACAVSSDIGMLVGFRFLAGCVSGTPMAIGGGTIHDLILRKKRRMAMGIFRSGLLVGPIIRPLITGYIVNALSWRWVFWLLAILVRDSALTLATHG
jgi:multidrug resistance protein